VRWLVGVLSVAAAAALLAPALLFSYSVDDKTFFDGVSDMSAFDASATTGIALDSQGGFRLATDGPPTVSTWTSPADFLGTTSVGTLEGLLTAEATGKDAVTGALMLRATPLALDLDANNPIVQTVSSASDRADGYEVQGPSVVRVSASDYRMYYTGVAADGYRQRIFEARSTNGTTWTKLNGPGYGGCVLDLGAPASFDEYGLVRPAVVYQASSATPFRMWYGGVGRDSGAIGYATSLDGHTWVKSHDASGTPVPVVGPGAFGSADGYSVGEPSVSFDPLTRMYRMWYAASPSPDVKGRAVGFATSTDTAQDANGAIWSKGGLVSISGSGGNYTGGWFSPGAWFETASPQHRMVFAGKKAGDQPYKLILADSTDGLGWSAGTIIVNPGSTGAWDENNVFWGSVLPDPAGSLYRIYYTGSSGAGDRSRSAIGYAPWGGTGGASASSRVLVASTPTERFDSNQSAQGAVWRNPHTGMLHMFYAGRSAGDLTWRIGMATATDATGTWTSVDGSADPLTKAVLSLGPGGSFDESGAVSASIAALDDGATTIVMAYEGVSSPGVSSIGIATTTPDALSSWTRAGSAAISHSAIGFDSVQVSHPSLVRTPAGMRVYYAGFDGTKWEIGVATATAGISGWHKAPAAVLAKGAVGSLDERGVSDPVVSFDASSADPYRLWYTAEDGTGVKRVAYATSTDGLSWTKRGLAVVPSGEPWAFDEMGVRAGSVFYDAAAGTWHLFYDGIDRGNLGNSAGNPTVTWRRIGHATGKDAGYLSNGQATYTLVPTGTPVPGYKFDFRDFSWDATAPAGSTARFEVSFYPAYIMANGTPVDAWSPYMPIDGEEKPLLPLTTEKVRWRVSLAHDAGVTTITPVLDEMRITWAPVHFETTGTAISIPVGPTAGKYIDRWNSLDVSMLPMSLATSASVSVLDTSGRTLVGPTPLTGTSTSIPLTGLDSSTQQLRVRFDLSGNGQATPYVKNWSVSYVSTNRAPVELFQAFGMAHGTRVTWVEPSYDGLQSTRVLRRLDTFPTSPTDPSATVVYEASATAGAQRSFEETGFADGQPVFYTAYTTDGAGWSPPARTLAVPRAPLTSLAATPLSASVSLSWSQPTSITVSYMGVTVAKREATVPLGPSDPAATVVVRDVKATSATDPDAKPGVRLWYAAYIHDVLQVGGAYYDAYSVPATTSVVPLWQAPLYFDAMGYNTAARVSGRVPTSGSATCTVVIVRSTTRVPRTPTDGTRVYSRVLSAGEAIGYTATGLTNMRPVYFSSFVIARSSEGVTLTSGPARAAALPRTKRLGSFKAKAGDRRVSLSWSRPASFSSSTYGYSYGGVRVIRGTGGYPWGVMDPAATVLVSGSKTLSGFTDTGLTNLTTYGYRGYVRVRIAKGSFVDYDYGYPSSALAMPKYTPLHVLDCVGFNKFVSPYFCYRYGRSIVMNGSVTPDHATLSTGAPGYVTVYVYLRKGSTGHYYYSVVKKSKVYLTSGVTTSTWTLSYRGAKGTYKLRAYFPGDGNHLPAWSTTRYAKVY